MFQRVASWCVPIFEDRGTLPILGNTFGCSLNLPATVIGVMVGVVAFMFLFYGLSVAFLFEKAKRNWHWLTILGLMTYFYTALNCSGCSNELSMQSFVGCITSPICETIKPLLFWATLAVLAITAYKVGVG